MGVHNGEVAGAMISCGSCMRTSIAEQFIAHAFRPAHFTGEGTGCMELIMEIGSRRGRESTLYAPLPSIVLIGLCSVVQDPAPAQVQT